MIIILLIAFIIVLILLIFLIISLCRAAKQYDYLYKDNDEYNEYDNE